MKLTTDYAIRTVVFLLLGSQGLSPTYEQAHVGLDLGTLASLLYRKKRKITTGRAHL